MAVTDRPAAGRVLRRLRVSVWRLRRWRGLAEIALARRFGLATRNDRVFFLLIPVVGLLAGLLGIFVTELTGALQGLLWGSSGMLLPAARLAPGWVRVGAPIAGGVLVGLVAWRAKHPVGGHGTSRLLEAVALRGGKVEPRPVIASALAGVFTVGSGGSLGREGPTIGLGAMAASWLGSRLGLPAYRVKVLLACGAAAGMAAIYNTPIGGALFAMEVILGNFALEIFGPIVISSVLATVVARSFRGAMPIYAAPGYALVSRWELAAYVGLGLVAVPVSLAFVFALRGASRLFRGTRWLPYWLHPVVGMAGVGLLGLYVPYVYGNGFDAITLALHQQLPIALLLVLPLAKLAATALTAGSGGSGGLFTPSMFLGALVGGAYGYGLHAMWPDSTAAYGAYAAVGMAAIAAGTSHAPISSILIVFEFTGNYDLILPLMLASITASLASRGLHADSIYTESLRRSGVDLSWRMEEAILAGLAVADLMREDPAILAPADDYKTVVERFLSTRRQRLYVVGKDGRLLGAVSLHDIKHLLEDPAALTAVLAHDLMTPVAVAVERDARLHRAAEAFAASDFERLPVVEGEERRFCGVLAKRDLLAIYAQEVLGRPAMLATFVTSQEEEKRRDYVELPPDYTVRRVPVPARLAGRSLAEARLPQTAGVWALELARPGPSGVERVIPDATTQLAAGDELVVLGPTAAVEALASGRAAGADEAAAHQEID